MTDVVISDWSEEIQAAKGIPAKPDVWVWRTRTELLIVEVRRLRQERDEAIAERDQRRSRLVLCASLQDEVNRLREALAQFGEHRRGPDHRPCPTEFEPFAACTYGFDAALAGEG